MIIAVSGSDGFVGREVCKLLKARGDSIINIDIKNGRDLCDLLTLSQIPLFDSFIHLANLAYVPRSYSEPELFYRVNYLTTLNALELCRKYDAHLIYVSSYIYGPPQYLPVDEKHVVNPFNPYAQTKVICESLCQGYNRDFGTKISIIRPFNIYGKGQQGRLLIPEIFSQLQEGKKVIKLKSATSRRDYVNVVDVARAICDCLNICSNYDVYNVCSGKSISVKEVTEVINRNLKERVIFSFTESDRKIEIDESVGSFQKIAKELNWMPSITFEDGIIEIIKSINL